MARIPLQVAQRGLDTGNVVQYPTGGQVGAALEGFGDTVNSATQRIADAVRARQEQQDAFDARVRETEFSSQIGGLETDAAQNAPADGSGIHDSVYGEIDPSTGHAVKPGSFDKLFDSYLERMPERKRADFAAKREAYRLEGSNRLAAVQYKSRQAYEQVEIQKVQTQITNAMAAGDPNDIDTFEKFKKQGLDLIEASGLPALEKDVAKTNWLANADETLFKTKLAKDPEFATKARAALGLAPSAAYEAPSVSPGGPGGASRAAGALQRGRGIANYFQGKGLSPVAAAAIAGAFMQENGGRFDGRPGDGGKSFGAAQWNGERLAGLKKFAASRGKAWNDGETQLDYVLWEMENGDAGARRAGRELRAATTIEQAAEAMMHFERPSGYSQDNPRGGHAFANRLRYAKEVAGQNPDAGVLAAADPAFANIPLERRLVLANQADVQVGEMQRTAAAAQKAEYTSYKDAIELSVVQGGIVDEAVISNDRILNDGDKATLIRSVRTQNETANQIKADLAALSDGTLTLDPYAAKDKTRADNLYADAVKRVPPEQQGAVAGAIIEQTGVVPQPVVNAIRQGLSSQNPADVVSAAQLAQRISRTDSAALGRRDGGGEVQSAADDFAYYVDRLNLSPEDAARRLIDARDPQKQRDRRALEPAAKEFRKEVEGESIAAMFDDAWFSDPQVGFTPGSEYGIKAEFLAIAEDKFYANNGNADLAMNAAKEEMKRLYGVTRLTGRPVVMKHPPERYWPQNQVPFLGSLAGETPLSYATRQLEADIREVDPNYQSGTASLVTMPATDHEIKRGEMPGYAVMWTDENGNLQTLLQPDGKPFSWKPDTKVVDIQNKSRGEREQRDRLERARGADDAMRGIYDQPPFSGGATVPGTMLGIDPATPQFPVTPGPETLRDKLDERKGQLFENAPTGNAMGDQF